MKKLKNIAVVAVYALVATIGLSSFTNSEGYGIGDQVKDVKLKNVDGKMVSMADYNDAKGFIVIFTCNTCPYSVAYEDRIKAIDEKYSPLGYPVIAINSNDPRKYPQDSFENMKVRAERKNFSFPYLFDETQEIARTYRAICTPHVFLLHKVEGELELGYQGAIDDNYRDPKAVTQHYLTDQLDNVIATGTFTYQETQPIGCSIKWK